ncbi:tRNA-modifying protein YgfZ [Parashewanella curva]|uniref:tRNA-modifying protein YgfZ n=1 Tax=Parashewanella curva TaxID=2338552 RepID=A0A3L8PUY3_9GAMM|nr:tRNA-modifying protein YgfZ [Parashewanella curva]RLV59211.1 tRNA-modifying protein YgfZ [Parashewanella curva]
MSVTLHNPDWSLQETVPDLLIAKLSHLGIISAEGQQASSFLHGQVTADVAGLSENNWVWGAHCDPKGKMLASFRLVRAYEQFLMLMPKSTVAADLPQLQKYAVFSQVTLDDASDQWVIFGVAGAKAEAFVSERFGEISSKVTVVNDGFIIKDSERFLILMSTGKASELFGDQKVYESSSWQALEIANGYPNVSANHRGEYIPQMCNLQAVGGISFNKGCYMGQETVARMKYRGGLKRALFILEGNVSGKLNKDAILEIELESGFRKAGNIIEYVQRDDEVLLTAVLANDTDSSAHLRVAGDLDSRLQIKSLPYSLEEDE